VARLALLGALVIAATALSTPALGSARHESGRSVLDVVSLEPLRVRGARFTAGETVRVTARIGGSATIARVRAGRHGGFVVVLRPSPAPCLSSFRLVAVGNRGSRAELAVDHVTCAPTS